MELSAYNINSSGKLVYTGLPINKPSIPITFEHHNGGFYSQYMGNNDRQYNVWGINQYGLLHGKKY